MMYCEKCENPVTYDDKAAKKCPHCGAKLRAVLVLILLLSFVGCGSYETVSPDVAKRAAELSSPFAKQIEQQAQTIDTTLFEVREIRDEVKQNTTALAAIKSQIDSLEASLIVPKSESGKEVITSDVDPASVAQGNTGSSGPGRLASDGTRLKWNVEGNWNPTILETSQHLGEDHGINTDGMTHQEMADLHAAIHDGTAKNGGAPVSGTIFQNNRASAVASQRITVRSVPRRKGFFGWTRNSFSQSCPSGRCPSR